MLYNTAHLWHNITEVAYVAQAMVNFRMDDDIKKGMEQACKDMGMSARGMKVTNSIGNKVYIFDCAIAANEGIPVEFKE